MQRADSHVGGSLSTKGNDPIQLQRQGLGVFVSRIVNRRRESRWYLGSVSPSYRAGPRSVARDRRDALSPLAIVVVITSIAVLYFLAAEFGFQLAFATKQVSAVWPSTGLAAAAYLLFGWRAWPGVNAVSDEPLLTAAGIAVGNSAAGLVGIGLLHRLVDFNPRLDDVPSVLGWAVFVAAAGCIVSASNGVVQLALGGIIPWTAIPSVWWVWWMGDTMGVLLFGPLLLALIWPPGDRLSPRQWAEIGLLFATLAALCDLTFTRQIVETGSPFRFEFAVFPFVIWIALRCSQREVAFAIVLVSGFAIWGATHDRGPFALGAQDQRLIMLELFMAATAITGLILRAATAQRRLAELALRAANDNLEVRVQQRTSELADRKQIERALAEERELLRVTLQSIADAVITTDSQGRTVWMNPVAERLTGWSHESARDQPLAQVFHVINEESRKPAENPVAICLGRQPVTGPLGGKVLISRDGTEYGIEDSAAPIRDSQGKILGAVLVFHDVSEQRRLSREMNFRAKHDDLTSLLNRTEFEERLRRTLAKTHEDQGMHALLYIDLDQFKLVNDACGHAMGDQLLRQIASLLRHCVRTRDTLARLGGDEFGVILEHCSAAEAQRVAQLICDRIEEFRFTHDGRRFRVGTSIGLVQVDQRWSNAAELLQAADTSCIAAKEAGRNRVHSWIDTDETIKGRRAETHWASRLEQALDEDRFELYWQRIDRVDGTLGALHFEVLLRLRDTDGTLIAPGAFLPAAERFHMASRVDRWVLRNVFAWMEASSALEHVGTVAVNLSGQSIGDRAFHRAVEKLIASASFDVSKLCFEITETAAVTRLDDAAVFIEAVRNLGVRIALDDFGAGVSSFGYVKTLPIDFLKIDGQFIRDLIGNPLDGAAVRCFREVAEVIGVKTVAEHVEGAATLATLRNLGIDYAQGYLTHRPEPLAALPAYAMARYGCAALTQGVFLGNSHSAEHLKS